MTDLIPIIAEDQGDGTAQMRRMVPAEHLEAVQRLFDWLPPDSVFISNGAGVVGAIRLGPGCTLARLGAESIGSLTREQQRDNLGLPALFAAKAAAIHGHEFVDAITDINWSTLEDDRMLVRRGGAFVWVDEPTGGGSGTSGLENPLDEDLDLGGFAIVDGDVELLKVQDGKIYLNAKEIFGFDVTGATEGEVPRFDETVGEAGEFVSALPKVGDLVGGAPGSLLVVGNDQRVAESSAIADNGTNLFFPELPTSDPNVAGAAWLDGSAVMVSAGPTAGAAWSATPASPFSLSGTEGEQDFTPTTQDTTLTNDGAGSIDWTASTGVPWMTVSPASGSLAAGESVVVTATSVQAELANLSDGTTSGAITFAGAGVPNITRALSVDVAAAVVPTNRAAVFADDPTKYGTATWAPTAQDYTIRVRANFGGTDDSPVLGGDIYADLGLIKKGSNEFQLWVNGAGLTTTGLTIVNGTYSTYELAKVGTTITVKKDDVTTDTFTTSNSVPTSAFAIRIGALISGNANGMEGSIDFIELIDPNDDTNTAVFNFNADDFANSHAPSTVPDGANVGGVTFEDA